jgi:AcrR family transcriptional regulator
MGARKIMAPVGEPSLRARKKAKTRDRLVEAAAGLFHERGFEAVTVSEIARAAEVSEQTVYNYFSNKEALVLDEDEAYTVHFAAMVRDRPAGTSAIEAVRREALEFLQRVIDRPASPYRRGGMPYLVVNSPPLRRAWLAACERHAKAVAAALVLDSHGKFSRGAADIVAMSLLSVFRVIVDEVGAALTADEDLPARLNALRPQIEEGMAWLAGGLDRQSREPPA